MNGPTSSGRPDASRLVFVSTSRNHQHEVLRVADPETGAVRDVMEETVPTFFESGNGRINWHVLAGRNQVLWFSERDDWGNLYLYDLATGALRNRITSGPGNVLQVLTDRRAEPDAVVHRRRAGRPGGIPISATSTGWTSTAGALRC